jgi:hypothetical protein
LPTSALLASFHSGRWVCSHSPPPGSRRAGLGQHDGGELLAQRGQHRLAVVVAHQQAVGADRLCGAAGAPIGLVVEVDRVPSGWAICSAWGFSGRGRRRS